MWGVAGMLDCADGEVRESLRSHFRTWDDVPACGGEDAPSAAQTKAAEGADCEAADRSGDGAGALGDCGHEHGWETNLLDE